MFEPTRAPDLADLARGAAVGGRASSSRPSATGSCTAFRNDPATKGQVLDTGLWRYTRHPNYFGDACVWWGISLVALHRAGRADSHRSCRRC